MCACEILPRILIDNLYCFKHTWNSNVDAYHGKWALMPSSVLELLPNFKSTYFANMNPPNILVKLSYDKTNNKVNLTINRATQNFTMLSEFNGKIIVLWLTENFDSNVTKVKISNYSGTLTIPAVHYNVNQRWKFNTEDGVLNKLMYSPNFYDFDSEQYHKVILQEKLNGSYIV